MSELKKPVNRRELLPDEDRFSPEAVVEALRKRGRIAEHLQSADEIAEYFAENARAGDLILVMSNGSFDGLCAKALDKLNAVRVRA